MFKLRNLPISLSDQLTPCHVAQTLALSGTSQAGLRMKKQKPSTGNTGFRSWGTALSRNAVTLRSSVQDTSESIKRRSGGADVLFQIEKDRESVHGTCCGNG